MTRHRTRVWVFLFCLGWHPGLADGLRDVQDSWLLDTLESARLLRGEWNGPAGGWSLEAVQGRLFGLAELPQQGVRGSWRSRGRRGLEVGLARQETGTDLFRTTGMEAWVSWGRQPGLGLLYRTRQAGSVAGGWPTWRRISATIQGEVSLGDGHALWRVHLPVTGPPPGAIPEGREAFCRLTWQVRSWAVVWQVDRDPAGRPCSGWALQMKLGHGAGVGLRADGSSGTCGMSLLVLRGLFMLRTSHLAHPRLGLMHRFSVGVVRP